MWTTENNFSYDFFFRRLASYNLCELRLWIKRRFCFSRRKHWHHVGMFINDKSTALRCEQSFAAKTDNNVFKINSCVLWVDVETSADWSFCNPLAVGSVRCLPYRRQPSQAAEARCQSISQYKKFSFFNRWWRLVRLRNIPPRILILFRTIATLEE